MGRFLDTSSNLQLLKSLTETLTYWSHLKSSEIHELAGLRRCSYLARTLRWLPGHLVVQLPLLVSAVRSVVGCVYRGQISGGRSRNLWPCRLRRTWSVCHGHVGDGWRWPHHSSSTEICRGKDKMDYNGFVLAMKAVAVPEMPVTICDLNLQLGCWCKKVPGCLPVMCSFEYF